MQPILLLIILLSLTSCSGIQHLDEALVLKSYSDEQDAQARAVREQDWKFEELLALVQSGASLSGYQRKNDFVERFGVPVLTEKRYQSDHRFEERCLYRYATHYFDSPKVYVFFDEKGQFLRIEQEGIAKR